MWDLRSRKDREKVEADRKRQLLLDYSEVLSRLIIFLGAGMSIRTAWDRIGGGLPESQARRKDAVQTRI